MENFTVDQLVDYILGVYHTKVQSNKSANTVGSLKDMDTLQTFQYAAAQELMKRIRQQWTFGIIKKNAKTVTLPNFLYNISEMTADTIFALILQKKTTISADNSQRIFFIDNGKKYAINEAEKIIVTGDKI